MTAHCLGCSRVMCSGLHENGLHVLRFEYLVPRQHSLGGCGLVRSTPLDKGFEVSNDSCYSWCATSCLLSVGCQLSLPLCLYSAIKDSNPLKP